MSAYWMSLRRPKETRGFGSSSPLSISFLSLFTPLALFFGVRVRSRRGEGRCDGRKRLSVIKQRTGRKTEMSVGE
jgi:hypothetical protein